MTHDVAPAPPTPAGAGKLRRPWVPAGFVSAADARFVVAAFLVSRGALLLLAYLGRFLIHENLPNGNKDFVAFPANRLLDSLCRWDSGWYHRIALRGYYFEGNQSDVAFFPAFPYLARWIGRPFGSDFVGGLLLNHVALLGGLFFLLALARAYLDERGSRRAVIYALVFPSSVFFSFFYSEALFFLAVTAALYFYERGRLLPAALCGALASATRLAGVLLLPALLLGALRRNGYRPAARMAWLALIAAGLGLFMATLWVQVRAPLVFISAQEGWGRSAQFPLLTLYRAYEGLHADAWGAFTAIDLLAAVGTLVAGLYATFKLDLAHGLFVLGSILVPLSSGQMMGLERYAVCAVPVFLVLARATKNELADRAAFFVASLAFALHVLLFTNWYWAG